MAKGEKEQLHNTNVAVRERGQAGVNWRLNTERRISRNEIDILKENKQILKEKVAMDKNVFCINEREGADKKRLRLISNDTIFPFLAMLG